MSKGYTDKSENNSTLSNNLPDWYWPFGLHDAQILSINKIELSPDWKSKQPRRNCLEFCLNNSQIIGHRDIEKIRFYNYKIETPEANTNDLKETWWISDTLTPLSSGGYRLEINISVTPRKNKQFTIKFEFAETQNTNTK